MTSKKFKNLMMNAGATFLAAMSMTTAFAQTQNMQNEITSLNEVANIVQIINEKDVGEQANFVKEMREILQKQQQNKIISHGMKVKVNASENQDEKTYENHMEVKDGECHITLTFSKEGKIVNLTREEDTLKLVKLQNKTQEKYAREFIALHEAAHCEFETIKNPVQDFSKDSQFNEKLNYVIRDMDFKVATNSEESKTVYAGYTSMLNESYADVNAILGLIKNYESAENLKEGKISNDLNFVINAIITQREVNYLERVANNKIADYHYTADSLKELIKPENLKKIEQLNENKDIKDFTLEIANKGTQKSIAGNEKLKIVTLSIMNDDVIESLIKKTLFNLQEKETSINEAIKKSVSQVKEVNFTSSSQDLVKALLAKEDLKDLKSYSSEKIMEKANEIANNKYNSEFFEEYRENLLAVREFKKDITVENKNIKEVNKETVSSMIEKAKEDFKERTSSENKEYQISKVSIANRISEIRNKAFEQTQNTNKLIIK